MEEELSRPKAMPRVPGAVRLGIFLPNQRNAFYISSASDATDATYAEVRNTTLLGEEVGLSFVLPVARWKGLRGAEVDFCPYGQETITLAAGLLEATSRITVFSTIHTPLFNPVVAAKMGATMDHIGDGRWGMNIVAGWSQADFDSMGLVLREHEDRYVEAAAWLRAVRELWLTGTSSQTAESFVLDHAECSPRPLQEGGPVVVNAGRSTTGMRFAIDNADYLFSASPTAEEFKVVTEELGGTDVGYIGRKFVIVRPTRAEAHDVANRHRRGQRHPRPGPAPRARESVARRDDEGARRPEAAAGGRARRRDHRLARRGGGRARRMEHVRRRSTGSA